MVLMTAANKNPLSLEIWFIAICVSIRQFPIYHARAWRVLENIVLPAISPRYNNAP